MPGPHALTTGAAIACPHAPGRAAIPAPPAPRAKLTVRGAPVLVAADLAACAIAGCPQPPQTQDVAVGPITGGQARTLRIAGQAALLDEPFAATSDKGAALRVPAGGAGQAKLRAR